MVKPENCWWTHGCGVCRQRRPPVQEYICANTCISKHCISQGMKYLRKTAGWLPQFPLWQTALCLVNNPPANQGRLDLAAHQVAGPR